MADTNDSALVAQLPRVWIGFVLVAAFFATAFAIGLAVGLARAQGFDVSRHENRYEWLYVIFAIASLIYWLACVYRIHSILQDASEWQHPISPRHFIVGHFIPLYNFFFVFYWPFCLARFLNSRAGANRWSGWLVAVLMVLGEFARLVDGGIVMFAALAYTCRELRKALLAGPAANPPQTVALTELNLT